MHYIYHSQKRLVLLYVGPKGGVIPLRQSYKRRPNVVSLHVSPSKTGLLMLHQTQ